MSSHDWAVVLAGGSGERLAHLTGGASGVSVPKQFCSLGGGESLLNMALRRAAAIAPPARTMASLTQQHEAWWRNLRDILPAENLVAQPVQRGTGIGILHPLLEILERDAAASVAVLPSDHYVADEPILTASLRRAMQYARKLPGRILLLGFEPEEPDSELGYIAPTSTAAEWNLRGVRRFVEKPEARAAHALIRRGALWNSFIVAADGHALLDAFQRRFPVIVRRLREFLAAPAAEALRRDETVTLFERLPSIDFSREILARNIDFLRVMPVPACGWTDLGTETKLRRTLSRYGAVLSKSPAAAPGMRGPIDLAQQASHIRARAATEPGASLHQRNRHDHQMDHLRRH